MSNDNTQIRYCRKCGCELISTKKKKLCDNCRRERAKNIRSFAGAIFSIGVLVITLGKHGGKKA